MSVSDRFVWGERLPTLPGNAFELRALESSDIGDLYEIFGDPEVARYWSRPAFDAVQGATDFLEEIRDGFATRQLFQWGIADPADRVVGTCTLFNFDREAWRCEVGFALARRRWGQALGFRAVATVLQFAFDALNLHRIEADADPRNERCLRLLGRLGFKREGVLRERYCLNGEIQDAVVLGLLRPEWRESDGQRSMTVA